MTVIAYSKKHNQIACDSRIIDINGLLIYSDEYEKFKRVGDALYFGAGDCVDAEELIDAIASNKPFESDTSASVLVVKGGEVKIVYNGSLKQYPCMNVEAIGSGSKFALSALDFGKAPQKAVEYAITRNAGCGGRVRVFDVNTLEEI